MLVLGLMPAQNSAAAQNPRHRRPQKPKHEAKSLEWACQIPKHNHCAYINWLPRVSAYALRQSSIDSIARRSQVICPQLVLLLSECSKPPVKANLLNMSLRLCLLLVLASVCASAATARPLVRNAVGDADMPPTTLNAAMNATILGDL